MRILLSCGFAVAVLALGACKREAVSLDDDTPAHRGRYSGIGINPPDMAWSKLNGVAKPVDKASASTADDTAVIVVVDSATGEVRQCGNLSGHCLGMNPWQRKLGPLQSAPASLSEHSAERRAAEAARVDDTEVTNVTESVPAH